MIRTLERVDDAVLAEIAEEQAIRKTSEVFLLFPLGSQFDHLIAMQLGKLGVFCLAADPAKVTADDVRRLNPKGIILSGGPVSVHTDPPPFDSRIFDLGIPVLGICLGFQLWAKAYCGCEVFGAEKREFGRHRLTVYEQNVPLFEGCGIESIVLQSHGDVIEDWHRSLNVFARTENTPIAAARYRHLWGVQFHPEVSDTQNGTKIFENFCFKICGAQDWFPAHDVAAQKVRELRQHIGGKKVLLALSGGSDSSVVAFLLKRAMVPDIDNLRAVYIKGIDRPDDEAYVFEYFRWLDLKVIDATNEFLRVLAGKTGPEKRVAMRTVYQEVLNQEIDRFGASFIAQGTLYTDISESGGGYVSGAQKARIKLHHNVGLEFHCEQLQPLADQVKDTARNIGRELQVPESLLVRHPFPGPGLVVRIEGEVTAEKLSVLRKLDEIYIEEIRRAGLYETIWQAGVELTSSVSTCTKGDDCASGMVVCIWAHWSENGFTTQAVEFDWNFLKRVARRMGNEVPEVGRVTVNITDKPFATIEWE